MLSQERWSTCSSSSLAHPYYPLPGLEKGGPLVLEGPGAAPVLFADPGNTRVHNLSKKIVKEIAKTNSISLSSMRRNALIS